MNALYRHCRISKQGHYKSVQHEIQWLRLEELVVGLIIQVREIHPAMGIRAIYELCQPQGIGRDSFVNIGMYYGLRVKVFRNKARTTFSSPYSRYQNLLKNKELDNINQLWTSDLTYFKVGEKDFYIVLIIDVYSRLIIGYSTADNMRAENNVAAMEMALKLRGLKSYNNKLIHHSDRGGQYISDTYTNLLKEYKIRISMCNLVYENAHIERVNGTIKNQYLIHWNITSFQQLQTQVQRAVETYNKHRPHSALNRMTPDAFEQNIKELNDSDRSKLSIWTASESKNQNPDQCIIQF
ncbi:IS3 family transposase [Dyadobacter sp. CY356]|uniref:IS3 family transposase n=1 Tax=Dyadobacter sp. CY356 TaxID=2906442 RepID=UPI001F175C45|nr:IS3 family transposase [Dyadobacter sp. CY356]MCF0059851.1 IS3 family transposase [Dyadobacter sp. CY356]